VVVTLALVFGPVLLEPSDFSGALYLWNLEAVVYGENYYDHHQSGDKAKQGEKGKDAETFESRRRIRGHGHNPSWGSGVGGKLG